MLAGFWLAVAGLPIFVQPLPEAPSQPAVVALASGQVSLRQRCFAISCPGAEWTAGRRPPLPIVDARIVAPSKAPGAADQIAAIRSPRLATRRFISLYSPATRRDWFSTRGDHVRVDTTYSYHAVRTPGTDLRLDFGTGYRIEPYSDYGTRAAGPIARGGMQLSQRVGERGHLSQRVQVETGRENTYLRQIIGFDLELDPRWSLLSDFELRHDSAGNGGAGQTDKEGSVRLRFAF